MVGTLKLAASAWMFGVVLGFVWGVVVVRLPIYFLWLNKCASFLLTSIPLIVILFWLHYPLQIQLAIVVDPFYTSLVVLSFFNMIATSEIVRQSISKIDVEYIQLAHVYGVSTKRIWFGILLPMVLFDALPAIVFLQMSILHMTIFASLISYEELFRVSQQINSLTYQPVEIYTILALLFLFMSAPFIYISKWLKSSYSYKDSQ